MAPFWILSVASGLLFVLVDSKSSETITLSKSTCLGSTFYTVGATQEFYVVWSRNSHSGAYLSSECRVTFNPTESRSKICVEVESYNIQDCNIHVNYYDNEAAVQTQQTYGCMSTPGKFCAEENDDLDIGLSFDNIYKLYESESSFRLRVYAQQHEDYTWVIGLVAVVAVTVGVTVFFIIICRRKRSTGTVFRNTGIPHTRLINTSSGPSPMSSDLPPPYPGSGTVTSEYTVTVPVVVNTRQIV
ncbi:uncharacterized protein LOC125655567 [Ostrea edulis]|uniref:uncharacterized protein LOC125655567 n=1 Tax=Ostrea edulis TaxID=37623 RepID=UPI0024AF8133|nr:uncharacterized protein LOC125655567 [Ostrea edulis]XP_055999200.1 uncharacterized protein LOC125655567 [Ostrea edulis]